MNDTLRFPAEWESQSAILIAWPHADTDWADRLGDVEDTYIALVAAITRFQPVVIIVADDDLEAYADARLRSNRIHVYAEVCNESPVFPEVGQVPPP